MTTPNLNVIMEGDDALCITAMYMALGAGAFLETMNHSDYELIADERGGHIGIMSDLLLLAAESENRLKFLGVTDYPGVYDYEVSEPFGKWFAENDPTHNDATAKLHEMIAAFFAQNNEVPA